MIRKWIPASLIMMVLLTGMRGQGGQAKDIDPQRAEHRDPGTAQEPLSPPNIVSSGTITLPGAQITALTVYETGNKVFAADDNSQSIHVIDGTTNAVITTVHNVGGAVFDMAVNETYGKVYAASDKACCTTGITPGNGLISVINANTNQIITQINPGTQGNNSYFILGNDEVHDKIYVAFFSGIGVIDASTNVYTFIPGTTGPYAYLNQMAINTLTNQVYLPTLNSGLTVINGSTLSVQTINYPAGSGQALDIAVNEVENKVYITMIKIPNQATMGIYILDRDTNNHWFVGADDLEPLAFSNTRNLLFTGVQVGSQAAIIDGTTNALTSINLGTNGIFDLKVHEETNRVYLVNREYTVVVSGSSKSVYDTIPSGLAPAGGLFFITVQINQNTGNVYVVNDGDTGIINVFQDNTFNDVPGNYWAWHFIERLYAAGITSGCSASPPMYCPTTAVTRDQMAVFLLKAKHGSGYVPPNATGDFLDVPTNYWAAAWIEQLAAEGITAGCGGGNYCPTTPVTRDQMAVFLLKAKHGSSYVPPIATGVFSDVPTNYWAARWIEQLAAEGVTGGCSTSPMQYCPGTPVTRDQMAVFLVRTFSLP